jgi:exonuclease III
LPLSICVSAFPTKKPCKKIDVLCLQESDLDYNLDHDLMRFPGFNYESEKNDHRSRVGVYIKSTVKCVRQNDVEGLNSHIIIINILAEKYRIINVYQSFNPYRNENA